MAAIEFRREGRIAHVVIDRPDHLNAITVEMDEMLAAAWTRINDDADIWCAILSARGERAFCIGADMSDRHEGSPALAFGGGLTGVGGPLVELEKPLIATVGGYCLGGGFELAMCADIIIAAETAQFGLPETKVGIIGDCGVLHRAVRQLPYRIAMAMILTGERIDSEAAERFGLVNEIVAPSDLEAAALRWAEKVTAASPLANQAAKAAVAARLDHPLEVALQTRFELIDAYARSADSREAKRSAREKTKPEWTGK